MRRRLNQLDAGYAQDSRGAIRVVFPVPNWQDYLALSFDEIRPFGATHVQVVRRLRAALVGLADTIVANESEAVDPDQCDAMRLVELCWV